jgi:molecular chaperone GrpE
MPAAEPTVPAAVETPTIPDDPLAPVVTLLQEVRQGIEQLQNTFNGTLRFDTAREAVIDRLHAELQEYKADLLLKMLSPLALDLMKLHDDLGQAIGDLQRSESPAASPSLLEAFRCDVQDALYRNGFEAFTGEEGGRFEASQQTVGRRVPTEDTALIGCIAGRLRPGFRYQGRIVRKESVSVYVANPRS